MTVIIDPWHGMCCATIRNGNDDGKYEKFLRYVDRYSLDTNNPELPKFGFTSMFYYQSMFVNFYIVEYFYLLFKLIKRKEKI